MTEKTAMAGMQQPKLHWTPPIAVRGIDSLVLNSPDRIVRLVPAE